MKSTAISLLIVTIILWVVVYNYNKSSVNTPSNTEMENRLDSVFPTPTSVPLDVTISPTIANITPTQVATESSTSSVIRY